MHNILVIKLRYIGDVLLATPVLRALRDQFPNARLTVAVNRGTEEILKWNPDVHETLVVPRGTLAGQLRFFRDLRRRGFDCVVDLTDGDRSAILTWVSGAPVRIGFNDEHRLRGQLYSTVVRVPQDILHRIGRNLSALRPLGIEPKASPPVLHTAPQDEAEAQCILERVGATSARLVMLQPGARYWFKAWPAERFAELADRLTDAHGCLVLIGGDAAERELAESVRTKARSSPVNLAGHTTLLQYAAVLKRCALFIGNDNGPMHMAAALGIPVVALFGPSDPAMWGPKGGPATAIYKGLDCRRCFHPTCFRKEGRCMNLISVDEVFAAAEKFLGAARDVNRNLLRSGELTALGMELRKAVLRRSHAERGIEKALMAEIRLSKERAWRRNPS